MKIIVQKIEGGIARVGIKGSVERKSWFRVQGISGRKRRGEGEGSWSKIVEKEALRVAGEGEGSWRGFGTEDRFREGGDALKTCTTC